MGREEKGERETEREIEGETGRERAGEARGWKEKEGREVSEERKKSPFPPRVF